MPRGRRPGSHQQIKCGICLHPERGRIDFLVCSGAGVQPTAKKFGVSYDSLRNHVAKHISQSYRDAVRSGPLQSEEQLRRLVAESGAGVIENLKAIYSGLASRWLHAFEAGDDHKLSLLTGKLHVNLEMQVCRRRFRSNRRQLCHLRRVPYLGADTRARRRRTRGTTDGWRHRRSAGADTAA